MYVYVHVCTCIHVCVCVYVCICVYVYVYIRMYACMCVYICVCMCVCMCVYVCMYVRMCVCVCQCKFLFLCVWVCVCQLGEELAMTCLPKYLRDVAMQVCVAILNLILLNLLCKRAFFEIISITIFIALTRFIFRDEFHKRVWLLM